MKPARRPISHPAKDSLTVLRLYVAGRSPNSVRAIAHLKTIIEEHLSGKYQLEIIDAFEQPERVLKDGIIVTPTLVKVSPAPSLKLVGDLSDREQVLMALGIETGAT